MTFPAGALDDLSGARLGSPLFRSWLLLLGVLPFDRHVFVLGAVGERHFVETSHSVLQKLWRHERFVTPYGSGGCVVHDKVVVEPRLGLLRPFAVKMAAAVFRHRHKKLTLLYR